MAIDFTQYQPPGVYVEDSTGGVVNRRFARGTTIALVGWGKGVRTYTEQIQLSGTDGVTLSMTGTQDGAEVVLRDTGAVLTEGEDYTETVAGSPTQTTIARQLTSVVDESATLTVGVAYQVAHPYYIENVVVTSNPAGTTYVEDTDYVVDYDNGTIRAIAGGALDPGPTAVLIDYDYCGIPDGDWVTVTYNYTDSSYYDVYKYDNYDDVRVAYGEMFDSDGNLTSQLSFAAYLAFLNGAGPLYCVAVENDAAATNVDYINALDKLKAYDDIDVVVPLTGDTVVHANAAAHATEMANNAAERRFILGTDGSSSPISSATLQTYAQNLNNRRVMLLSPSSVKFYNNYTNSVETLPAYYVAAALAGVAAKNNVYEALTSKRIQGFYKVGEVRSKTTKMEEARNGLCVIEDSTGALRVFHGITTETASVLTREFSIVFAKDRLMQILRDTFNTSIIGQPIVEDTLFAVKTMATGVLDMAQRSNYIVSYSDVEVRQNSLEPTRIDVKFVYEPPYPLNYVYVEFSVDLENGNINAVV